MLTSDLVRLTKKGQKLVPRYLAAKDRVRLSAVAAELVATYSNMVGRTRAELDEAVRAIDHTARDRLIVAGLRKLCEDRTVLEQESALDPPAVRREVFLRASRAHRAEAAFDRAAVLAEAAVALGSSAEDLDRALFADLRDAQIMRGFEPIGASELLDRYNVSLAQAALLRSTKVTLRCADSRPQALRDLFRAVRFFGLIHDVKRSGAREIEIVLDGPFSLFDAVKRYGVRLAMFLPRCLVLERYEIVAEVEWGTKRERGELHLSHADGLKPSLEPPIAVRSEIEDLVKAFTELESPWRVAHAEDLLVAFDGSVIVPDLVFEHRKTGEVVHLELLGFWSRAAVFRRIEQIEGGLGARLIVAASKHLRVSEQALDEGAGGSSLYVFRTTLSAREVLSRLEDRGRSIGTKTS
ncbi:MAG: DUF790 family protein [Polyangiaceae bacterium]